MLFHFITFFGFFSTCREFLFENFLRLKGRRKVSTLRLFKAKTKKQVAPAPDEPDAEAVNTHTEHGLAGSDEVTPAPEDDEYKAETAYAHTDDAARKGLPGRDKVDDGAHVVETVQAHTKIDSTMDPASDTTVSAPRGARVDTDRGGKRLRERVGDGGRRKGNRRKRRERRRRRKEKGKEKEKEKGKGKERR